jgi:hypothetical protein
LKFQSSFSLSLLKLLLFIFLLFSLKMARCQPTRGVSAASGLKTKKAEVAPNLDPLENRRVAYVFEEHEEVLHLNYGIPPTVRMFYLDPATLWINGSDITLFERIFMAGL